MEIYLDILFLENLVMNYLILLVAAKLSRTGTTTLRLFLGAVIGAIYVVLLILLPGMKIYYTAFAKFLLSFLIIAVAFSPKKIGSFLKTLAMFYISTFIFAGAAFTFFYFNQSGGFVKNGIIYAIWQFKWNYLFLFFSVITVGIIVKIFLEAARHKIAMERLMVRLKVAFESKSTELEALIDTGNTLHDPLTNMPVVVAEFKALKEILPFEIQSIFTDYKENDLNKVTEIISNSTWFSRFRLIPFNSLGKENGMMIGFKPDYIEVENKNAKKGIENVVIGICNKALSKSEKYNALLGPELV